MDDYPAAMGVMDGLTSQSLERIVTLLSRKLLNVPGVETCLARHCDPPCRLGSPTCGIVQIEKPGFPALLGKRGNAYVRALTHRSAILSKESKRALVTGGTGFIGSYLVRRLIHEGRKVVVLDNKAGKFFDELRDCGAEIQIGSVTDEVLVNELARGCHRIYHLAAAFRAINLPKSVYWAVNVKAAATTITSMLSHSPILQ